jgi:hypothetical protein
VLQPHNAKTKADISLAASYNKYHILLKTKASIKTQYNGQFLKNFPPNVMLLINWH